MIKKFSKLDAALTSILVISYIPLSFLIHQNEKYYPYILIMILVGLFFVIFESTRLCSPLIGTILGGAVPLSIFGPTLFIDPWQQNIESVLVSVPLGCQLGFLISTGSLLARDGKKGLQTSMPFLFNLKHSWIPYAFLLVLWISLTHLTRPSFISWFMFPVLTSPIIISLLFIIYRICSDNKDKIDRVFINLSKIPLLFIGSHILLLISGRTFNEQGGFWILYALLMLGLPLTALFLIVGLKIKKSEAKKLANS